MVEELRRRIELAMNQRYAGWPDNDLTRSKVAADLSFLHEIFPELDITAEVTEDRPPTGRWGRVAALVKRCGALIPK